MRKQQPYYDLESVKRLAQNGKIHLAGRAFRFILNRYDSENPAGIAKAVVFSIEKENYYKTDELSKRPGIFADIYRNVHCDEYPEENWYVKLLVADGETTLEIWSMNWDGFFH